MFPFQQFTERARKVLTLAQQEAEASGFSYIGTEHLLVGLLREADGLAAHVLTGLGVELEPTRAAIAQVLGEAGTIIQQIVPTARVKKVIELSFEEARRMGHNYVGTEHLLLGLLVEGDGIAARVLLDMGVTLDRVRADIARRLREYEQQPRPPSGTSVLYTAPLPVAPEVRRLLQAAAALAAARGSRTLNLDHLLDAMISSAGIEVLARLLDVRRHTAAKEQAIASQDYEAAAGHRTAERQARQVLDQAIDAWRQELEPPSREVS